MEQIDRLVDLQRAQMIVVSGCYLREHREHPKLKFARTSDVPALLDEYLRSRKSGEYKAKVEDKGNGNKQVISISDGCYGSCTFCSIKLVRGAHRSRPLTDILEEVSGAVQYCNTVKLTGIETAGYGLDCGSSLGSLLGTLFDAYPDLRVELGSLNPKLLCRYSREDLSKLAHPNVTGNIHIPLESASTTVLKSMRRGYTYKEYDRIWSQLSEMGVTRFSTDLIAGFPGESEDDHRLSLRFLETHDLKFAQLFFFEPRPGTNAAQQPQLDRSWRMARALELVAQYTASYMKFNEVDPVRMIQGQIVLPFNSNLNIKREELEHERAAVSC